MTYEQTLDYLYHQLPMYSRLGSAAYKSDLDNIRSLCEALGNPQNKIKTIHVAGTNGKGSTSHMLAAILQQAGYKTGLYTSPHIKHFGERIRVNGEMISENFVIDFTERTRELCEQLKPSFFELTVAMAFEYFAQQQTDIAVIETGLGGRLDSTNIITPLLSVITNIGYDHMNILGNTLEEIAFEKSGIMKEGIPVVIGETLKETRSLFIEEANKKNVPVIFAEEKYEVIYIAFEGGLLLCNIKNLETSVVEKLRLDLAGLYQAMNARTILCCVEQLKKHFEILEKHIHEGMENVKKITGLSGRWDILQNEPLVISDVAHNKDGILEVINQLKTIYPGADYHFILGFVKEKNAEDLLRLFPKESKFYFTNAHIPRALPATELKQKAEEAGLYGDAYDDVNAALENAKVAARKNDVILICGSFFILAELVTAPL